MLLDVFLSKWGKLSGGRGKARRFGPRVFRLEPLETRTLLSAAPLDGPPDVPQFAAADFAAALAEYGTALGSPDQTGVPAQKTVVLDDHGSQVDVTYSSESQTTQDGHFVVTRYVFTAVYSAFVNQAPVADPGGPYTVTEGQSLGLDASASSDPDGDPLTYRWDLNNDGLYDDATGATLTLGWDELEASGIGDDGQYQVGLQVDDGYGGTSQAVATITVINAPPEASILNAATLEPLGAQGESFAEGAPLELVARASDPALADTLTYAWSVTKNGDAYASGEGETLAFTPDDNGTYAVTLTVTDDDGGSTTVTATLEVANVAPEVQGLSAEPAVAGENQPITLRGFVADPGTADTHVLEVQWGDGSSQTLPISGADNAFELSHAYAAAGRYQITVTAWDDDQDSGTAGQAVFITGAAVHDGVLQIVGTETDDWVSVNKLSPHNVMVTASFLDGLWHSRTFDWQAVRRIEVHLLGGDDWASLAGSGAKPTLVDGGEGDDFLIGSRGPDVLLGGSGDDRLYGGLGRDVLIGGLGHDRLSGEGRGDLLIAGTTIYDADVGALLAIQAEWASPRPLETRAANLRGTGSGPRANGEVFLRAAATADQPATVLDDAASDVLVGQRAADWYFADLGASGLGTEDYLPVRSARDLFDQLSMA